MGRTTIKRLNRNQNQEKNKRGLSLRIFMETSCGVIAYKFLNGKPAFLMGRPGNYRGNHWSFPKGHLESGEDLEACARREFQEEVGQPAPEKLTYVGVVTYKSGKKRVHFFLGHFTGIENFKSNLIEIKIKDKTITVPELEAIGFYSEETCMGKLHPDCGEFLLGALFKTQLCQF